MKKLIILVAILISIGAHSQTVFGYWYGYANVKNRNDVNNYLVELILQPEKGYVKGVLNYYFKHTYRSLQVKGNYAGDSRTLSLYNIPVTYFGSPRGMEVDCIMNLRASLRAAKAGSNLVGAFVGLEENKYTCVDIVFNLALAADISQKDSVMKAIREYKETYQVWKPSAYDTLPSVNIVQRKVVNYVVEDEFKLRETVVADEIEVSSDTLKVDFYDNGEVDGDSVSVFFNKQLLAFSQKLSSRAIHFDLAIDTSIAVNELSMFANNLGAIPPNTALMIVTDGKKQHEIRLSSSLDKTATIRIRRKPK